MIVETFPVGALACNCTILGCERTRRAIVVDPGDDPERILARLQALRLEPVAAFHTHAHFDHLMATRALKEALGPEILLHRDDLPLYDNLQRQVAMFGMRADDPLPVDRFVAHDEDLAWGEGSGTVIHTPGHTPGSVCLHVPELGLLLAGDTLFMRGVGRTDLWGGSFERLEESIRDRLYVLPPETTVIAGHGPATTIGAERSQNPFVRA
ncbi:MAG: MBL fold metallo-hydrolase [Cyanobacteria bacterium REEB65]|nr:MBL fold metallo-hydrolase [Cyanobacteria bacterium REEB65]